MQSRARQYLAEVCGFLSEAWLPPSPGLSRYLQMPRVAELLRRHGLLSPEGMVARASLESAYNRNFRGTTWRAPLVLPTAAEYLGRAGDSQNVCRRFDTFYRAFGYAHTPELRPDHLAVAWGFLRFLLESEETAEEAGEEGKREMLAAARREFTSTHLLAADEPLFARVEREGRHAYYRALATLSRETARWLIERPIEQDDPRLLASPSELLASASQAATEGGNHGST